VAAEAKESAEEKAKAKADASKKIFHLLDCEFGADIKPTSEPDKEPQQQLPVKKPVPRRPDCGALHLQGFGALPSLAAPVPLLHFGGTHWARVAAAGVAAEMELAEKMEADPENDKDVWQYWSDNRLGNDSIRKIEGWDLFHDSVSSLCNKTLKCGIQSGPGTYIVSMRTATQVNKDTRYPRKVRRVVWEWKKPNGDWGGVYTCADALKLEQAFGARVQVLLHSRWKNLTNKKY
jgi:hypothetical protein